MKKMLAIVLLMVLWALPMAAARGEEGTIVQSSCSIVQSGEHYLAYCFAQVHNHTDQVLCLDEGMFRLKGGEETIAADEVSSLWPQFVAPGADGYLFDIVQFDSMPQVTGLEYDIQYLTISPAYAGEAMQTNAHVELDDESGALSVVCELINSGDTDAYNPMLAIGLYTDAGQLIYADGRNLKDVGVPAGGRLLVRFDVEYMLWEQWSSYGAVPTLVRAEAMYRTGSD